MSGSAAGCDQYTHGDLLLIWMCSISHVGVEPDGVIGLFFFPLFPQGAEILPFKAGALATSADVYHHAHLASSRMRLVPPEEKKGSEMPVLGRVLVTTAMLQNTCHAIWAMMPMPTSVQ